MTYNIRILNHILIGKGRLSLIAIEQRAGTLGRTGLMWETETNVSLPVVVFEGGLWETRRILGAMRAHMKVVAEIKDYTRGHALDRVLDMLQSAVRNGNRLTLERVKRLY